MERKTVAYIRISTNQQKTVSQKSDLLDWFKKNGIPWKSYTDTCTGKVMARGALTTLLQDISQGKIGRIVVWRLDRLGRDASGLIQLLDDLDKWNVELVSLREHFDLRTPTGKLVANVLASIAAFETELRAERVRAGQQAARRRGKTWGGSKPGSGTKLSQSKAMRALDMYRDGMKVTEIANAMQVSRPTIYKILREYPLLAVRPRPADDGTPKIPEEI